MRKALIALLRADGRVRHHDPSTMAWITSFFADHVESRLAQDARRHPLGFFFLTEKINASLTLRYHVWPVGWAIPHGQEGSETHDHYYELNSLIIQGSLHQKTFKTIDDMCGTHDILEVDYATGSSSLRCTGSKTNLDVVTEDTFGVGTAYRLESGLPHYVEVKERPSATLVLSVKVENAPPARVFVPTHLAAPGEFVRAGLTPAELDDAQAAIYGLRRSLPES
jgi:hypothetical protein